MKTESLKLSCVMAAASAVLLASPALRAQSTYSNAVMSLNPVAYWPLQENVQPPPAYVETNTGSLGPIANMYYADVSTNILTGFPGATADGDSAVEWAGNGQSFAIVPTTDNRVSLVGAKAFTVEGWRYPTSYNSYVTIACQTGPVGNPGSAGNNGINSACGWALEESWTPFRGTGAGNNPLRGWSFHVFNGGPFTVGAAYVGGAEAGGAFPYNLNQWYYVAGVFDGTNCNVYINGQLATSYQIPMSGSFVPDTWDPIELGCERGFGANPTHGGLDDVAIYTNALTAAQILAHYNAASVGSGVGSYTNVVINDNPVMYWRMDAPTPIPPTTNSYPIAMNYGSLGTKMTNFNTFSTNAVYQPGVLPGVAGPSYSGFGPFTNACAFNGIVGAVDAGYNPTLDPTGVTNQYSVVAWFRGNPTDINNRWNTICSHSDSSWKIVERQGNMYVYKGAGGLPAPPTTAPSAYNLNDGNWHMVVLESCYTNLVSTNMTLVLDGGAVSLSAANILPTPGKNTLDAFIGNGPEYLEPTNGFGNTYNSGQQTYAGRIAHVAYFTNALTASQIFNLYTNAGATPPPPVIIAQPSSGRTAGLGGVNGVGPGSYIFFGVQATGVGTLAYQWYYSSTSNYLGATKLVDDAVKYTNEATFNMTVSNLVNSDSGYYYVVITNAYGSTTSILASLTIAETPIITAQVPSGAFSAYVGQSPTLNVTASSVVTPLTYQWYTNGVADTTAGTGSSYALTSVQTSMTGSTYQCVVSNQFGSATGSLDTLTVNLLPAALTNGLYSSNILSLGPTAYWPMHDAGAAAQGDIETNYGTLGALGTGFYGDWDDNGADPGGFFIFHQMTGALSNDNNTCIGVNTGTGSYLLIPRTSPRLTLTPPFTVETWVKPYNLSSGIILSEGGGTSLNGVPYPSGFNLIWNNAANCFSFVTYANGIGYETRTANAYNPGTWYHVVATYSGSNAVFYVNGSLVLASTPKMPMAIDYSSPFCIGGGSWNGNIQGQFAGSIDEVAVYTNLLDPSRITQHYNSGLNPGTYGRYFTNILADKPLVYMRMDSAPYFAPPASTWPILTNYGSSAISGTYAPGVAPNSIAGPSANLGNGTPLSGMSGFADAGFNQAFNPVNRTSFSYTFWFKANPTDTRFQTMFGHSDSSWRCSLTANGYIQFHTAADVVDTNSVFNDGGWHDLVATYAGGTTNGTATLYVDGNLETNVVITSTNAGSTFDAMLGADPQYTNNPAGPGRQFAGSLCEVAFFNGVVLSPAQVQSLYGAADQPPFIRQQPISASVNEFGAFTNTVLAGGSPTLSYQWYTNGVALGGATGPALGFNPVTTNNAGTYYVVITNNYGAVTSAVVTLTVYSGPAFTSVQPVTYTNLIVLYGGTNAGGTIYAGSSPSFSVSAVGALPLSYQWLTNGVAMGGATNTSFTFTNCQLSSPTNFACVVSNVVGLATNVWSAFYTPAPTAPYPQAVLAGQPLTYWRLNEGPDNLNGDNGVICDDYNGGNNGFYTNVIDSVLPGYDSVTDPNEACTFFGAVPNNCDVNSILGPDFGAPGGSNQEFTVEAWVMPTTTAEPGNGAIVERGYFNQEEFDLDYNGHFRFVVRNSAGTLSQATSTLSTAPPSAINKWYHLVGVCDEANGLVTIYTNGSVSGTAAIIPFSGITNSSIAPIYIGARPNSSISGANNQFIGEIDDVAVFNYALTPSQVAAQYSGSGVAPFFVQAPSAPGGITNVTAGTNLVLSPVTVEGSPLMTNWWTIVTPGNTVVTNLFTGVTNGALLNASIVISNVSALWNGDSVELAVSNAYGGITSFTKLNVASAPVITSDLPPLLTLLAGRYYTYTIGAVGTQPLAYQWYNGAAPIPGQTNSTYNYARQTPATNFISVIITNVNGAATSIVSTVQVVANYQNLVLGAGPVAFWPLNERPDDNAGDDGVIAHDISGYANNAVYTNSVIGLPGLPGDTNTAALFGSFSNTNSMAIELAANPDIAALANANNGNGEFSVEAWVNGPAQNLNARIVDQGHFFAEEWALDCGTTVPADAFRFSVRNASAAEYDARGTVVADGNWHHLVGVCDQSNSLVMLYVDGVLNASNNFGGAIAPGAGIEDDPQPITIGNGDSSQTGVGTYTPEFRGQIADVAVYTNVLSPNTILTHYQTELSGSPIALSITNQLPIPGTSVFTLYAGVKPSFMVGVAGLPPYAYQWYSNGVAVAGATNSVFSPGKVQIGSFTNYCIITNAAGSITSMVWNASVVADPTTLFAATVLSNNPVAYWRLNESGGGIANDYAGGASGFYGTNTTVGLLGVPYGNLAGETSVGMNHNASTIAAGSITNCGVILTTNAASFLCWVYPTVNPENNPSGLIFCRSGSTASGSQIGGANNLDYTWSNSPATYNYGSGLVVPANLWSLCALTITPSNAVLYVLNANSIASATNSVANGVQSFVNGLNIGADPIATTRILQGQMSEAAIFPYTLSAAQLTQMYSAATNAVVTFTNAPPITFKLVNPNQLILNWPSNYTGYYYLQVQTNSTSKGLSTNWVPMGGSIPVTLNVNTWTNVINPANGCVFYRLMMNP